MCQRPQKTGFKKIMSLLTAVVFIIENPATAISFNPARKTTLRPSAAISSHAGENLKELLTGPAIDEINSLVKGRDEVEDKVIEALQEALLSILEHKKEKCSLRELLDKFDEWAEEAGVKGISDEFGLSKAIKDFRRQQKVAKWFRRSDKKEKLQPAEIEAQRKSESENRPFLGEHPVYKALIRLVRGWRKKDAHCHRTDSVHEGFLYEEARKNEEIRKDFKDKIEQEELSGLSAEDIALKGRKFTKPAAMKKILEALEKYGGRPWVELKEGEKQDIRGLFRSISRTSHSIIKGDADFKAETVRRMIRQHFRDGVAEVYFRISLSEFNREESLSALKSYLTGLYKIFREEEERAQRAFGGSHKVYLVPIFGRGDPRNNIEKSQRGTWPRGRLNEGMFWKIWEKEHVAVVKNIKRALDSIDLGGEDKDFKSRFYGIDIAGREFPYSRRAAKAMKEVFVEAKRGGFEHLFMHLGDIGNIGRLRGKASARPREYMREHLIFVLNTLKYMKRYGIVLDRITHGLIIAPKGSRMTKRECKGMALDEKGLKIAEEIMELLKENNTGIEICLTGNIETTEIEAFRDHPAHQWWRKGVSIYFGTDGHWSREPRTLSEDIVRFLLTDEQIKIGTIHNIVAADREDRGSPELSSLVNNTREFRAAIFDFDGVVVDTENLHFKAWQRAFDEDANIKDFTLEAYQRHMLGKYTPVGCLALFHSRGELLHLKKYVDKDKKPEEYSQLSHKEKLAIAKINKIGSAKSRNYMELLETEGADVFESTVALIRELKEKGIPVALATNSNIPHIVLENAKPCGIKPLSIEEFDVVITRDDVKRPKPAPDMFLAAAEKLGVDPKDAVVFEDTAPGVEAAKAAGMACVAVDREGSEALSDIADKSVADLAEVDHADLATLVGSLAITVHADKAFLAESRVESIQAERALYYSINKAA